MTKFKAIVQCAVYMRFPTKEQFGPISESEKIAMIKKVQSEIKGKSYHQKLIGMLSKV